MSSPDELVIQMKKQTDGTAAWAATNQVSATVEGSLVWDDANGAIAYCDGTNWVSLDGGGNDNLGTHIATQNLQLNGAWLSGDGGNEGIFVTSTGRVGIGTDSPSKTLHVLGPVQFNGAADINGSVDISTALTVGYGANITRDLTVGYGANIARDLTVGRNLTVDSGTLFVNRVSNRVGIGTTSPSDTLHVNGTALALGWNVPSDERLKSDIFQIEDALVKIEALSGLSFVYTKNNRASLGLIAQDVERVFPTTVTTNAESSLKSVDYNQLIAPLIEAVKELSARNKALEFRIEALENEM